METPVVIFPERARSRKVRGHKARSFAVRWPESLFVLEEKLVLPSMIQPWLVEGKASIGTTKQEHQKRQQRWMATKNTDITATFHSNIITIFDVNDEISLRGNPQPGSSPTASWQNKRHCGQHQRHHT